jgi:hypothetical protein
MVADKTLKTTANHAAANLQPLRHDYESIAWYDGAAEPDVI